MTLSCSGHRVSDNGVRDSNRLIKNLELRNNIYGSIRDFFSRRGYIEVETPIIVPSPGIDIYIDAFCVGAGMYLNTSPELHMKRLLAMGMKKIFQFTRAFRKGELGCLHNTEFSLLEWYHSERDYLFLMDEVEELVKKVASAAEELGLNFLNLGMESFPRYAVDDLFETYAGWTPSKSWNEERFFLDYVDRVEPNLAREPAVIIYDFPSPLASLSRLKSDNPDICERFELYLGGIEVANAFSELTDPMEQRCRFISAQEKRGIMGKESYPIDEKYMGILEKNLLPPCAGIAMGLDRLLLALTGEHQIDLVMAFPYPYL